jgi:hypothetical protein
MSAPRTVVTALLGNEECVTVATLQEQARLLPGEENLLAMYITSAREMVEQYTGRAIRQKRYTASFDCQGCRPALVGRRSGSCSWCVDLPRD